MKHILEGGTDSASMLLFDPAALPEDYDTKAREDPAEILEGATLNGDAYWINTDGDGGHLLHLFVNEEVPPELAGHLLDEKKVPDFKIPSGRLYFAGSEYGFRHDDSFLKKHPHMGGLARVEPGHYSLSLFRTEYPEGMAEDRLRGRVSGLAFWLHQSLGWFVLPALIGLPCVIVPFFEPDLLPFLLPAGIALISLPFAVCRLPIYKNAAKIWNEIQSDYPSIVAILKTTKTPL